MKTILVAGGAGFIGSHLCEYLLLKKNYVFCVDSLLTGSKKNIKHLEDKKNFKLIKHDIIKPLYLKNRRIDQIYNLACPASPIHYQHNAIHTIKANTLGVINILGLAKKHRARVLQASTSEVYGDPLEHPQKESYWGNVNPIGIRSCYDEGKRVAETLFFDYFRQNKTDIRVARIFNTYGPKMAENDGRVVSNFITQAINGKNITIYGNGSQTRSFCYVSDMIIGLYKLMNQNRVIGPVNMGNPRETAIKEIAEKILKLTNTNSKLIFMPLPKDDPRKRKPDISTAKKYLNWEPKISLEAGLVKTINYFKK